MAEPPSRLYMVRIEDGLVSGRRDQWAAALLWVNRETILPASLRLHSALYA